MVLPPHENCEKQASVYLSFTPIICGCIGNVSRTLLRRIILTIVAASQLAISTVAPVGRFAPACGGHQGLLKRMGYTTFFESPAPQESISKQLYFHSRATKGCELLKQCHCDLRENP